ncbi:hypothetical protein DSO57_1018339 [Entomophthora muscae]|uniref:Uncharacterized protein n=1 Tax=Entomophthora muscae TaxID=34485 RepID=A0ACC2RVJ9_9FUNG|nr:hypothetical protein DSO57_1018339 [Entomophthora muscae]
MKASPGSSEVHPDSILRRAGLLLFRKPVSGIAALLTAPPAQGQPDSKRLYERQIAEIMRQPNCPKQK